MDFLLFDVLQQAACGSSYNFYKETLCILKEIMASWQ